MGAKHFVSFDSIMLWCWKACVQEESIISDIHGYVQYLYNEGAHNTCLSWKLRSKYALIRGGVG